MSVVVVIGVLCWMCIGLCVMCVVVLFDYIVDGCLGLRASESLYCDCGA